MDKLTACLRLLADNTNVFVTIIPSARGVMVPSWCRKDKELALCIGYQQAHPIPDLRINNTGIIATLSFDRVAHLCAWPWDAVVQMHGERSGYFNYRKDLEAKAVISFGVAGTKREPFKPYVIQGGKKS